MKRFKISRRNFVKGSAFITGSAAGASLFAGNNPELEAAPASPEAASATRTTALAQCPYCGVGCGTIIQAENGKIVSMRPDKDHPTNYGLQCIKGLTAAEPMYVDRMEGDAYVRKDVWLPGFISTTLRKPPTNAGYRPLRRINQKLRPTLRQASARR